MGYDSKDLPRDQYEVIIPLLDHEGFKITYHNETETFTLDSENNSIPIEIEQIKELSTAVQSYFKFKFFEIIKAAYYQIGGFFYEFKNTTSLLTGGWFHYLPMRCFPWPGGVL